MRWNLRTAGTWLAVLAAAALAASPAGAAPLQDIRERGWIRVCAHPDALPFSSQDRAQPGFQLEIADAVARILGVRVIPEWIVFTRHARRAECDAVIGAVIPLADGDTPPPARGALLTKPYAGGGYVLAVPGGNTAVHRVEDVGPGKIGVEYTSWPHYLLQTHNIPLTAYRSQTDIIEGIASGEVAAGMVTDPYLGWFLKTHPGSALKIADGYARDRQLQWNVAIRLINADPALRDAVNQALERLLADGTIKGIFAKYGVNHVQPF
jgi:polar amino acid transport system substrate-binding protein